MLLITHVSLLSDKNFYWWRESAGYEPVLSGVHALNPCIILDVVLRNGVQSIMKTHAFHLAMLRGLKPCSQLYKVRSTIYENMDSAILRPREIDCRIKYNHQHSGIALILLPLACDILACKEHRYLAPPAAHPVSGSAGSLREHGVNGIRTAHE